MRQRAGQGRRARGSCAVLGLQGTHRPTNACAMFNKALLSEGMKLQPYLRHLCSHQRHPLLAWHALAVALRPPPLNLPGVAPHLPVLYVAGSRLQRRERGQHRAGGAVLEGTGLLSEGSRRAPMCPTLLRLRCLFVQHNGTLRCATLPPCHALPRGAPAHRFPPPPPPPRCCCPPRRTA